MSNFVPSIVDPALIPAILADDPYHPLNDDFAKKIASVEREMMEVMSKMEPWEIKAVKDFENGVPIRDIAKSAKKRKDIVTTFVNSVSARTLLSYHHHYSILLDGANESQRKNVLWEIVQKNKDSDPKEARGAIVELNRMNAPKVSGSNQPLQIVINNAIMPKGALDG
jgi:hypothetical protein